MTNAGSRAVAFRAKVEHARAALKAVNLFLSENHRPDYKGMATVVRKAPYIEEYGYYESKSLYDLKLTDGALFQFKDEPDANSLASFCFYESPLAVDDFNSFVYSRHGQMPEELSEFAEILEDEYESYLSSADLKKSVLTIRYDHSPKLYKEGCHPASHIHIGYGNEIRLGTARVMNPISFTMFVLRQVYPAHWRQLIFRPDINDYVRHVRSELLAVDAEYFNEKDRWEIYLE